MRDKESQQHRFWQRGLDRGPPGGGTSAPMRILITGATGTAGAGALRQALAHPRVTGVTALVRRPLALEHPKLAVVVHADFLDYEPLRGPLAGHDAALWCLGTSQSRVSREDLHRITVDFVVAGAKALQAASPGLRFVHLSGEGADPTLRSRMAFAQEKGQAENALDALALAGLWHVRPGYIHPPAPVEKPLFQDRLMWTLAPLFRRVAPRMMIDADVLGRAMVAIALDGLPAGEKVVANSRLLEIAAGAAGG